MVIINDQFSGLAVLTEGGLGIPRFLVIATAGCGSMCGVT